MLLRFFDRFFGGDSSGGLVLMFSAALALAFANTDLAQIYDQLLASRLVVTLEGIGIEKPLVLWINDGLMAIFFFLVGLELKREVLDGKLRDPRQIVLPGLAAVGGMVVPAAIYAAINWGDPVALRGWAIPTATDIAFALGVLALIGSRAPASLKIFLLTLAILDDLGAIVIIALFYTENLSAMALVLAALPLIGLIGLNRTGSRHGPLYLLCGLALWVFVLKSGVHATLAGVACALFIPMRTKDGAKMLERYEHGLTPYVLYGVLPLFAFANAGVALGGLGIDDALSPLPLGIALGLVLGKQVGVFAMAWLAVRLGLAKLPQDVDWRQIYGVACLAGIGFTMSLFVGSLSFDSSLQMNEMRLGVLAGSILSGAIGFAVLWRAGREPVSQKAKAA